MELAGPLAIVALLLGTAAGPQVGRTPYSPAGPAQPDNVFDPSLAGQNESDCGLTARGRTDPGGPVCRAQEGTALARLRCTPIPWRRAATAALAVTTGSRWVPSERRPDHLAGPAQRADGNRPAARLPVPDPRLASPARRGPGTPRDQLPDAYPIAEPSAGRAPRQALRLPEGGTPLILLALGLLALLLARRYLR